MVDHRTAPTPSELEGVVLGIVHGLQPCTPYGVRKELTRSPSTIWSASAGSIYPLIKRLVRTGRLEATADLTDGRGRQLLHLTPTGLEVLRQWTVAGVDPAVVGRLYDSIRLRVYSFAALEPAERIRFAQDALAMLEDHLQTTRRHLAKSPRSRVSFENLGDRGAVYQAEARVRWMREVLSALE